MGHLTIYGLLSFSFLHRSLRALERDQKKPKVFEPSHSAHEQSCSIEEDTIAVIT